MEITFDKMPYGTDRDVEWYLAAQVLHAGTRYPVRIMIDGPELLRSGYETPELNEDVIKAFYRQELETLVRNDRLKPQNPRTLAVNVVFCVNDRRDQVRDSDVVIDGMCAKLKTIAAGRGKPTA